MEPIAGSGRGLVLTREPQTTPRRFEKTSHKEVALEEIGCVRRPPPAARAAHAHAPSLAPPRRAPPQGHDSGTAPLPCCTYKGFPCFAFYIHKGLPCFPFKCTRCTPLQTALRDAAVQAEAGHGGRGGGRRRVGVAALPEHGEQATRAVTRRARPAKTLLWFVLLYSKNSSYTPSSVRRSTAAVSFSPRDLAL